MGALGWLRQRKASGNAAVPPEAEIEAFLSGAAPGSRFNYICRCGAHARMVQAISDAAAEVLK
jgi:nicotinate dehydrogenase subunit A